MSKIKSHYDNFKLERTATSNEIHERYAAILTWILKNPTMSQDEKNKNLAILKKSLDVLLDPEQRRLHDEWLIHQETAQSQRINEHYAKAREQQRLAESVVKTHAPLNDSTSTPTIADTTAIRIGQEKYTGSMIQFKCGGWHGVGEKDCEVSHRGVVVGNQRIETSEVRSLIAHSRESYLNGIKSGTTATIFVKSPNTILEIGFHSSLYGKTATNKFNEVLDVIMEHQGKALLALIIDQIDRGEQFKYGGGTITFDKNAVTLTTKKLFGSDKREVIPYDRMAFVTRNGEFIIASDRKDADGLKMSYEYDNVCLAPHLCSFLKERAQRQAS